MDMIPNLNTERSNMNALTATRRSRFVSKDEVGDGAVVTIDELRKESVKSPDGKSEDRAVLYFQEDGVKPLILNSTNARSITNALGTPEADDWRGRAIELYHDKSVDFGGKPIGGIRVRAVTDIPF
jgi:hypothetical protein